MAKQITTKWQEAVNLLSKCRIEETPGVPSPDTILFLLRDPANQLFVLKITSVPLLGKNGNVVVLNGSFQIECFEPEKGDRFGDRIF